MFDPTDRELFRRIWSLSWPTVLYYLLEMTVGLVDLLMVRSLGQAATAAIGVNRQVTFLVEAAAIAISTGVITLVSQGVGARRQSQVDDVVRQSIGLILLLGIPTTLAGYLLSRPLLVWLHASAETLAHGEPYLRVYFAGIVFLWGNFVGTAIFRGSGDATTPLKLALCVNLLNVVLNYMFIFGAGPLPAFGVQGAAMGTVAARACGALAYLGSLLRGTRHVRLRLGAAGMPETPSPLPLSPTGERGWPEGGPSTTEGEKGEGVTWWGLDWKLIRRMLRIGVPMALAGVLRNSSRLVFLGMVGATAMGVSFHAAVGVGLQVRLVGILPALAFQVATATLVGQAIGRGEYQEAEALGRRSVQLLALLMLIVVSAIIALAGPLGALFIDSPETAKLGARVLRWFAVAQLFSALSIATQGALMGAGDTAPAMRYTLLTQWGVMLPLTYVLLKAVGWVPDGPLAAWTLAPAISLVLMQWRLRSGRWKLLRS
ncbi:MAG: MATE family efflux transporter [Terriglobia bacterium]